MMEAAEANANPLNETALASVNAIAETAVAAAAGGWGKRSGLATSASEDAAVPAPASVAVTEMEAAAAFAAADAEGPVDPSFGAGSSLAVVEAATVEFDAAASAAASMMSFAVIPTDAKDPRVVAALRDAAEAQVAGRERHLVSYTTIVVRSFVHFFSLTCVDVSFTRGFTRLNATRRGSLSATLVVKRELSSHDVFYVYYPLTRL